MSTLNYIAISLLLILLFSHCTSDNQNILKSKTQQCGHINGYITSDTSKGIIGAKIETHPPTDTFYTDSSGFFSIDSIPVGEYLIISSKSNFSPDSQLVIVFTDSITTVNFSLLKKTLIATTDSSEYSYNGSPVFIYLTIKNVTDSTVYFSHCGGLYIHAIERFEKEEWKKISWWGRICLDIYSQGVKALEVDSLYREKIVFSSQGIYRLFYPFGRSYDSSREDSLYSNTFIIR